MNHSTIEYRHPNKKDGAAVYALVKASPPLDVNSQYYYHLICHDFADTCVVAQQGETIVGFISAYRQPKNPQCLFVWQAAVAEQARGQNLAFTMLQWLTKQSKQVINRLETTISPSNIASQKFMQRVAHAYKADCITLPFLDKTDFGCGSHEDEILYSISPLNFK